MQTGRPAGASPKSVDAIVCRWPQMQQVSVVNWESKWVELLLGRDVPDPQWTNNQERVFTSSHKQCTRHWEERGPTKCIPAGSETIREQLNRLNDQWSHEPGNDRPNASREDLLWGSKWIGQNVRKTDKQIILQLDNFRDREVPEISGSAQA